MAYAAPDYTSSTLMHTSDKSALWMLGRFDPRCPNPEDLRYIPIDPIASHRISSRPVRYPSRLGLQPECLAPPITCWSTSSRSMTVPRTFVCCWAETGAFLTRILGSAAWTANILSGWTCTEQPEGSISKEISTCLASLARTARCHLPLDNKLFQHLCQK